MLCCIDTHAIASAIQCQTFRFMFDMVKRDFQRVICSWIRIAAPGSRCIMAKIGMHALTAMTEGFLFHHDPLL